jgi:hypothetical protein
MKFKIIIGSNSVNFIRFAGLFCSFLLLGCGPPADQPVLGTIFQLEGTVIIGDTTQSPTKRPTGRGDTVAAGDEIRVGRKSSAVLCLTPGIYLRCFEETHLRIEALTVSKDGDETANAMNGRRAAVRFEEGRIDFSLPAAGPSQTILRIDSPNGALSAKAGSLFSITVKDESMRIVCARGEVSSIEADSAATTVGAGYFWETQREPDPPSKPGLVADDATAQAEIMRLLESAEVITELEDAARNAPAPWRR